MVLPRYPPTELASDGARGRHKTRSYRSTCDGRFAIFRIVTLPLLALHEMRTMPENNLETDSVTNSLNRRGVIKGAAWSVPVISMAVGVPTASASPTPPGTPTTPSGGGNWSVGSGAIVANLPISSGSCETFAAQVVSYSITLQSGLVVTQAQQAVGVNLVTRSFVILQTTFPGLFSPQGLLSAQVTINVTSNCGGSTGLQTLNWTATPLPGGIVGQWVAA